jgi:uncharacterized protein
MTESNKVERMQVVDALRGFALAGIVVAHMYEQFIAAPRPAGGWGVTPDLGDQITGGFVWMLVYGKFYSLFALLFGVSFGIMMKRAAAVGKDFSKRFLWRLSLLLLIGIFHAALYRGDILTAYVLIGLVLPALYRVADRWLWTLIILLMLVYGLAGKASFLPWESTPTSPEVARYVDVLKHGTLLDVVKENLSTGLAHKFDFLFAIFGRAYMTLAYFLLGMWLVRHRIVHNLGAYRPQLKRVLWISSALTVIFFVLMMFAFIKMPDMTQFTQWRHVLAFSFYNYFNIAMTLVLGSGFALLFLRAKGRWKNALAVYGRTALSNYILQSLIGTTLFFGFGFGLLGELHDWQTLLLAFVIILLQIKISGIWLRHFRYGPLEWLWRSGTYRQWLPLRKSADMEAQSIS